MVLVNFCLRFPNPQSYHTKCLPSWRSLGACARRSFPVTCVSWQNYLLENFQQLTDECPQLLTLDLNDDRVSNKHAWET